MHDVIEGNLEIPESRRSMRVLLDIDGTISHSPEFFSQFSDKFSDIAEIHVVTCRYFDEEEKASAIKELDDYGIKYHHLVFTYEKGVYAIEQGINIVFEDSDEFIAQMHPGVVCFKTRERDNYDWNSKRWIYDNSTGIHLEDLT